MAWNEQPPQWGKKRPSSPEEVIVALLKKIRDLFEGGNSGGGGPKGGSDSEEPGPPAAGQPEMKGAIGKIVVVIGAVFLFQILYSSFYTIEPGEQGVVLRFGEYTKIASPGLNFLIPFIDDVIKVNVEKVQKEEFGFRTKLPGQKTEYEKRGYDMESLMLTGDKNVIDVEWIVQYKVKDPVNYVFKVQDVSQSVRDVTEAAIRRIIGNQDFDYILDNREIIESSTQRELQSALNTYESGVDILTVKLQDVNPPEAVKPAFNEVNEADQDMKRLQNEAEETYNRVIPKARGSAKQTIEESEGYAVERTNLASGETSRYLALLEEYRAAKDVTRKRMYLETMQKVLPTVSEIYVIDKEQRSLLPLLDLTERNKK